MARTVDCLVTYRTILKAYGVDKPLVVATAAVREATNRANFLDLVREKAGWEVRVLSGPEEAWYTYLGVLAGLDTLPEETVVVDVGGGSTEFVWLADGSPVCRSLLLGAVRMTEQRYSDAEMAALVAPVAAELAERPKERRLVGVGGTVTTLAALHQRLVIYDPDRVHGYRLRLEEVARLAEVLETSTIEERKRLPGLQPERADIIPAGARIVATVMRVLAVPEITVSEADILHGLALYGRAGVETKSPDHHQI
jgi:exopolyphosphatase/guanosine-5'-triphosphate,3'-diphosphate pyrophosphatase